MTSQKGYYPTMIVIKYHMAGQGPSEPLYGSVNMIWPARLSTKFRVRLCFASKVWPQASFGEPLECLECQHACFMMAPKTGPKKVVKTWRPYRDLDCMLYAVNLNLNFMLSLTWARVGAPQSMCWCQWLCK